MTLQSSEDMSAPAGSFPERPGQPDCLYYIRTGLCGFGRRCRFNHPPNRKMLQCKSEAKKLSDGGRQAAAVARDKRQYPERIGQPECQAAAIARDKGEDPEQIGQPECQAAAIARDKGEDPERIGQPECQTAAVVRDKGEYPERIGQPECKYYLKTGTCNFDSTCKYHHPKEKAGSLGRVTVNVVDIPLHPMDDEISIIERLPTPTKWRRMRRRGIEVDKHYEDCYIVDEDPENALSSKSDLTNSMEDLVLVSERGQIACRDLPHSRHHCMQYAFSKTPSFDNAKHCQLCFCYACDIAAPCKWWGSGEDAGSHCNASDKSKVWNLQRKKAVSAKCNNR